MLNYDLATSALGTIILLAIIACALVIYDNAGQRRKP